MNTQLKILCAGLALVSATASAQIRDGGYDGRIQCGASLTNTSQGPWTQPLRLQVSGNSLLWERTEPQRFTEVGMGTFQNGQVSLDLVGSWSPGERNTGQWRTVVALKLDGKALAGSATIYAADGKQRVRDCSVLIPVEVNMPVVASSARTAEPIRTVSTPSQLAGWTVGQRERIQFMASNPRSRWALIRGQLGPEQMITGDLLMPTKNVDSKIPVVVMSHGSDGITSGMHDVWAKPLNDAGYAVFMVDSFSPRNSAKIAGTDGQLTWNTTANISDAVYALKLLSSHPLIDAKRIYHMGWSRGGNAVTGAMWPNYQLPITKSESVKWAGSIALYPGCNLRYKNPTLKLASPVLYLLGEKDDMTPSQACVEEAQLLAAEGNPITFKVYAGAYHVFDRMSQPWKTVHEGTYAKCALDVKMPTGVHDVGSWGPGFNRATNKSIETPEEYEAAGKQCEGTFWITVESHAKAREQAVKDVLAFLREH
ncbi:dienelactone hydrolase family protein [Rhodoferax sp.]|uniref:dienelactone hydrolase family protein n=1 Tax=Rhodoferax sp. TaxID=50421 RepID=UPI00374D826B